MDIVSPQSVAQVEPLYKSLRSKFRRSSGIFIALNVATFVMTALTIILSLWAVGVNNPDARIYFIGIAVLTALIAFFNGMISAFTFGQASRRAKTKIENIEKEEALFEQKAGDYANEATSLEAFIRKVTAIYNG